MCAVMRLMASVLAVITMAVAPVTSVTTDTTGSPPVLVSRQGFALSPFHHYYENTAPVHILKLVMPI